LCAIEARCRLDPSGTDPGRLEELMTHRPRTCSGAHALLVVGLLVLQSAACGPTNDTGGGGADSGLTSDAGGWQWDYDGGRYNDAIQDPDFYPDAAACAAETTRGQTMPLDIFIMMDQSGSMSDSVGSGTKWTAVTSALMTFLEQPLVDVSVGIQYFGLPPGGHNCGVYDCVTDADCGAGCGPCVLDPYYGTGYCNGAGGSDSCDAADYSHADVEIAPIADVALQIQTSIDKHGPTTSTPTSAALQGAINHAKAWGGYHAQHVTIVLLATDGDPTECDTDLGTIDTIAAAGLAGTPRIATFVVGVGASLSNLNGIAAAGGTGQAFLVDTGGNVQQQFLQAMNQIRGAALGCQYKLPAVDGGMADLSKVNVQFVPGSGGQTQVFPQVQDKAHCPTTGDAWYYDNAAAPTQILLCDSTCGTVRADSGGEIDVLVGCTTVIQ
jgi:hypothetical protein